MPKLRRLHLALALTGLSCEPSLPRGTPTPITYFTATTDERRFHVADHMLASVEMQLSGEPFAQLLGFDLLGFDRFARQTDGYTDPSTGETRIDPLGYASAIESYEYSKQPMNNLSFESGAGVSLQFAPLLNPSGATGDGAYQLLVDRLQQFADESHAAGTFVVSPAPLDNPLNVYGWPGYWPQFLEYRSFDPRVTPSAGATRGCTLVGGYAAASLGAQQVGDYECGYNSLNLIDRDAQVEKVIEPAALGFAAWKQGLWVINYWQTLHDGFGDAITVVADADLARVGQPGNTVVGRYVDPTDPSGQRLLDGKAGVYLGDNALEGWQGLTMLEELDEKSAALLGRLTTTDGRTLAGFASTKEALAYDFTAPLRYWPAAVAVTENATAPSSDLDDKFFPQPIAWTISDGTSRLVDLIALAGGFGEFYALTDFHNGDVGGLPSSRATFDGDPFAADDQTADGEESPHDRALGVIKVALVDLDRLHWDDAHHVLVDGAQLDGSGHVARGSLVSTREAAYAIVALRTARRAITSSLTLYSNDTPDSLGVPTALDGTAWAGGSPAGIGARLDALIRAEADFLAGTLVTGAAGGDVAVANAYDLAKGAGDGAATDIAAEASAIRGLLEGYLATSDERYRARAVDVYADLERRFWMADVRAFRTTAGVDDTQQWTPRRFGALTGALRQYWKLVASRPGQERARAELLERWKRLHKLVLNGWDDANGNDRVEFPDECTGAGLQMAERALTGELSNPRDGGDRDHDCVLEIATAKLPAALAGQITLTRRK